MNKLRKHTISFRNAINGLIWLLESQPNYQIHIFLSFLAIIGGIYFKISINEWLLIVVLITIGLSIESINSSIEATGDSIGKGWNENIKHAKDSSAAAMLIFSIGALVSAFIIFLPKIFKILGCY